MLKLDGYRALADHTEWTSELLNHLSTQLTAVKLGTVTPQSYKTKQQMFHVCCKHSRAQSATEFRVETTNFNLVPLHYLALLSTCIVLLSRQ